MDDMTRTPPQGFAEAIASEVRAEMARQRKTQGDLADALGISRPTAAKRLNAVQPFDASELYVVATWLGVPPSQFWPADDGIPA